MSLYKQIVAAEEEELQIKLNGGVGVKYIAGENGISPPQHTPHVASGSLRSTSTCTTRAAVAATQLPAHLSQHAITDASMPRLSQAAASKRPHHQPMLPTGVIDHAAKSRLERLNHIYAELRNTEAALYWFGMYLPKREVNDTLKQYKAELEAEIAELTKAGAACTPSSKPSTTRR